jgi:signal transduction histidine kinase
VTAVADRVRAADRRGALAVVAYAVLLLACAALSLTWLAVGAVVGVAAQVPAVAAALAGAAGEGNRWAQGVVAALPASGPGAQAVLDHGFSLLTLVIAGVLIAGRDRSWSIRLLVLALVGSAGAFNLQAHAAATAVESAIGLQIGSLHQVLLHGVACAAYILALLMFPPDREARTGEGARTVLVTAGSATLLLVGFGTALLPHTTSCVLFFGFLVPIAGLVVLPRQIRAAPTTTARTQARLLFSVLAAAFAIAAVLAVITVLLWSTGWRGMVLVDPTAHAGEPGSGEPTALLFWFSRLACIAIAGAVFVATRRGGLWTAERLFSRGLAAGLTAALVGGGYVVVRRTAATLIAPLIEDGALAATVLATVLAALALLPVYVRAERLADRLLFGARPTPYRVLAGITALSRVTATDAPDLARVAEAVGRGLGAATCRLTVVRPGLRDRSYTWAAGAQHEPEELVEVEVRHGSEAIGTLAVDYAAVAGLQPQRRHLLEDVADSLGVVLQASRFGIELERQLRAALAHANEIAVSRRAVVAEMDGERRRIERDLHDGAQHHLVSLRLTLGLVEHQVSTAQFDKARSRLEQFVDQIDMAESILAETAMGVSSPLLAEVGLVRALDKELAAGQPPVAVDARGVDGQFPHDIESAVYFCCLEAVNNARKHAEGATVGVRLRVEGARLRFTVDDDGPGWDQARAGASPGRGLRNVTTRVCAVGGRIEIRSAIGRGTTVEGSVPLPQPESQPAGSQPAESQPAEPRPAFPAAAAPLRSLSDEVRDALREARELYRATPHADALGRLARRIEAPPRTAVAGDGSAALVEALAALVPQAPLFERASSDSAPAGAFVLVLRRDAGGDVLLPDAPAGAAPHRPAHAVGALVVEGPVDEPAQQAAADCGSRPGVRRLCHVVVPVAPALARAGTGLSVEQYAVLQRRADQRRADQRRADQRRADQEAEPDGARQPTPAVVAAGGGVARPEPAAVPATGDDPGTTPVPFGPAVVRFAVEAIRSGRARTCQGLAAMLVQHSGLPGLGELVAQRLTPRAAALTARSVLLALEHLVRAEPPPAGGDLLLYRLDRLRSGAHELAELDTVDALRAGELDVPHEERAAIERLLGAAGPDPHTRLALALDAGQQEVLRAAAEQLAHWQRHAANPLAGTDLRTVADVLVRTCERLLAD